MSSMMGPRLYGSPPPLPGELFSSWATRVARWHRMTSDELRGVLKLSKPFHWFDFRKPVSDSLGAVIAPFLGQTSEDLKHFWEGSPALRSELMIRSLTTLNGTSAFYSYCPTCLREDETPYFRREWRLNCFLVCNQHPLQMRWYCAQCEHVTSIENLRIGLFDSEDRKDVLRACFHCGVRLQECNARELSGTTWERLCRLQSKILRVLSAGTVSVTGIGSISAEKFLQSYFCAEDDEKKRLVLLLGLDFRRIYGIHRHDLLAELDTHPGIALEDTSEYVIYEKEPTSVQKVASTLISTLPKVNSLDVAVVSWDIDLKGILP
ncbi:MULTISPECIES: TniQ family protein [Silvimonas]|uniref:TniQ family protein n=1 Tax=Silvimonas TaxID=300264 RepID=UPI00166E8BCB|nr:MULTISPECIES: TniQ family protein [Silvimonas]